MARVGVAVLAALAATCGLFAQPAHAATCASICATDVIYGFLPGGTTGCTCSGSGASHSGSSVCQCGPCYDEQSDGTVLGYALVDGACTFGTDCSDCDESASASASASLSGSSSGSSTGSNSSSSGTATAAPTPTPTPVLTARASNVSTSTTTDAPTASASNASSSQASASHSASRSGDGSAGSGDAGASASGDGTSNNNAGSSSSSSDSGGLKTWQIALIICSAVLAFGVACVSILTCYCKARRRLQETEEDEEAAYYHPPRSGSAGSGLTDAGLTAALMSAQRPSSNHSHSQHGFKATPPMDGEPMMGTYSSSLDGGDRIGIGMPARRSNGSNGDLAGSFNADRRPSQGSYSLGRRPSDDVYYSTRDRDAMAVEL